MGKLLRESNEGRDQHNASKHRQESSAELPRYLPYKQPSIIPLHIFEVLLDFALTLMPQDRAVFLTVTHWIVSNTRVIVLFSVRFVTKDILQPFNMYRLEGSEPAIVKQMAKYWKLFIEDLSILNLKVIGSISNPCHVITQVIMRLNKELDLTNEFSYTILPYKDLVHIFCAQKLYLSFSKIIELVGYIYFISVDNYESKGIVCNGIKLAHVEAIDVINILEGLEATVKQDDTTNTAKAARDIVENLRNFCDSIIKYPEITPDRFVLIVNESSNLIRFSATAKFSLVEIKYSDVFKPTTSPIDHYEMYRKLLSMPRILQEKTGFPLNPYYLLSKDVGWHFMKPSGCVGKRSVGLRQEIARRANEHRRNLDDASGISKPTAGTLSNDSETHSSVKDESDVLHETADGRNAGNSTTTSDTSSQPKNEARNSTLTEIKEEKTSEPPNVVSLMEDRSLVKIQKDDNKRVLQLEQTLNNLSNDVTKTMQDEENSTECAKGNGKSDDRLPQDTTAHDSIIIDALCESLYTWIDGVFSTEYKKMQAAQNLNNDTENERALSIATELVDLVVTNAENIVALRRDAYNHLMNVMMQVTEPSYVFRYWIATLKGYLKLHDQMLKYNVKSIRADALDLAMSNAYMYNTSGQTSRSKILVYPNFDLDVVEDCMLYINSDSVTL